MRAGIFGVAAVSLSFLLVPIPGQAQSPPPGPPPQALPLLPGFLSPYEIARIARSAGFDPLARPLREGTTYVLRATDFRGTTMRVVVDARSGAIRAVNRIVVEPDTNGQIGMLTPSYGVPQAGGPAMAYGPPEFVTPDLAPDEVRAAPAPVLGFSGGHPLAAEPLPPLPRPRPAKLAARKAAENAKPAIRRSTEIVSAPAAATSASPSTAAAKGARPSSFQAD